MLVQNATKFCYKMCQNATVVTKCIDFTTKCGIYYKMRRQLQNDSVDGSLKLFKVLHERMQKQYMY